MSLSNSGPLPYSFEDRTGSNTDTDFDDIYDRMFFHVKRQPGCSTTHIYEMAIRASRHRSSLPLNREPSAILDFLPDESLGSLTFAGKTRVQTTTIPMSRYLRKTSLFGTWVCAPETMCHGFLIWFGSGMRSSLVRIFVGSDGKEYKWSYQASGGRPWSVSMYQRRIRRMCWLNGPVYHSWKLSRSTLRPQTSERSGLRCQRKHVNSVWAFCTCRFGWVLSFSRFWYLS